MLSILDRRLPCGNLALMFVLNCPMCSQSLQLHDQAASGTIVCPHCGKKIKLALSQPAANASLPSMPAPVPMPLMMPAAPPVPRGSGLLKAMLWIFLPAVVLLGAAGYYWYFHLRPISPLTQYAGLLPGDAVLALEMNLADLAAMLGLETETVKLATAFRAAFRDLDLEPRSAGLTAYFAAYTQDRHALFVWTFDEPVAFGKPLQGRFRETAADGRRTLADRYRPNWHWAVDAHGRLLHGPASLLEKALAQQANGATIAVDLERLARAIPGTPALWLAADLSRDAKSVQDLLPAVLAREFQEARVDTLMCYALHTEERGLVMKGKAACPTADDCQNTLAALQKIKKRFSRLTAGKLDQEEWRLLSKFLPHRGLDSDDKTVEMEMPLPVALTRLALDQRTAAVLAGHKVIVQAIRKDIRDLTIQAEKDFAAERYKEAGACQIKIVDLAPGNGKAQERLKDFAAARAKKERFLGFIAAAEKALLDLDADAVKTNLANARSLRGHDPALPELEKKLAVLAKRLEFNKMVAEGDQALARKDLAVAAEKFSGAAALGIDGDKIKPTLDMIRRLVTAGGQLHEARRHLEKREIDEAVADADKIKEAIFGAGRAVIEADARFKTMAEKIGADTLDLLVAAARITRLPSEALRRKGDKLFGERRYTDAETEYRSALMSLQQARQVLAKAAKLAVKDVFDVVATESKLVDVDIKSSEREADKCRGMAAHQRGKALAKDGREQFELGKKDGASLFKAREKFTEAVKHLEISVAVPGILAADDLKAARHYLQRVTRMIEPLDLDFAKERDLKDWGPLPKGWRFRNNKELTWLQTDLDAATGTFSSPALELPADFTLRVQFCLVDDAGEVRNNAWKSFADMLSITLVMPGENNLRMTIGRDPKSRQLESSLAVGSRTHVLSMDSAGGPIPLVLTRRQGDMAIEIAGRAIATIPSPGEIQRIILQVRNGPGPNKELRYFPAFTNIGLSLSTSADKTNKVDPKESTSCGGPIMMEKVLRMVAASRHAVALTRPRAD